MRKPNYNMERKDRDRAKQAKAAAKLEKRAAKGADKREEPGSSEAQDTQGDASPVAGKEGG
jgi:hypothetical protein